MKSMIFTTIGLAFAGCNIQATQNACAKGTAQIALGSNVIERDCGCQEGAGSFANQSLVCTVPVGTTLYFRFLDPQNAHQVAFNSYAYSPIYHEAGDQKKQSILLTTSSPGVTFTDIGNATGGTIVVQSSQ